MMSKTYLKFLYIGIVGIVIIILIYILINIPKSNNQYSTEPVCQYWKVRPISQIPQHYLKNQEISKVFKRKTSNGNLDIEEYIIADSMKFVLISQKERSEILDSNDNHIDTYWYSKILQINYYDTVVIEDDPHGISELSFRLDGSQFAYSKMTFQGEESNKSNIYYYDIESRTKQLLHVQIDFCSPVMSPKGYYLLYSDYGDLYICDLDFGSPERVFNGGGSYLLGSGCIDVGTSIHDIKWSEDSVSAVFRFTESWKDKEGQLYELFWESPKD
jgi:hypothetical protein